MYQLLQQTDARSEAAAGFSDCSWSSSREQHEPAETKTLQHIAASYINSLHMLYVVSSRYCKSKSLLFHLLTAGCICAGITEHIIIHTFTAISTQVLYPVIWHPELRGFVHFFSWAALCGWCILIWLLRERLVSAGRVVVTMFGRSGPFSSWQWICGFCDDNSHMVALEMCVSPEVDSYCILSAVSQGVWSFEDMWSFEGYSLN